MPRRKRIRSGRPVTLAYEDMDDSEKRAYHQKAVEIHRNKLKTTNQMKEKSTDVVADEHSRSVGRPPLGETAMSPTSLKKHMRTTNAKRRKNERLSEVRRKSILKRWSVTDEVNDEEEESELSESIMDDVSQVIDAVDVDQENVEDETISKATFYRLCSRLIGILPKNPFDNLKLFLISSKHFVTISGDSTGLENMGTLNMRQLRYKKELVYQNVLSSIIYDKSYSKKLLSYWLEKLMQNRFIEVFIMNNLIIPDDILSKAAKISTVATSIGEQFLRRHNTSQAQRKHGVGYVIDVAKKTDLSIKNYKDITALSSVTNCSRQFAKTVLKAIAEGREGELLERNVRCDAIKATTWPGKISTFVFLPENSRAIPGQESVSVRYGVRRPKFVLLDSKINIAQRFKDLNPDCPFSASVIAREFPQNAVSASRREVDRNTCPVHANARRLLACLHQNKVGKDIPMSCREMCARSMCDLDSVTVTDPLTWNEDCVNGKCINCGNILIKIPDNVRNIKVTYSSWEKGDRIQEDKDSTKKKTKGKKLKAKKVFGLFPITDTLDNVVQRFIHSIPKLREHIYTAHQQWNAHATARQNLSKDAIITIEDYQRNIEVEYFEKPTSLSYSSNQITVAVYPICIEFKKDDDKVHKGAITFISDDKSHDHQQVQAFEKRMFDILRNEQGLTINHWQRWTDGCGAQFKSQFCNADLIASIDNFDLTSSSFSYFESHEGKNTSDTIGSLIKCSFIKGLAKLNQGIGKASEVVDIVRASSKKETSKFDFFIVEEFKSFRRVEPNGRDNFEIMGITKIHFLRVKDRGLVAENLTCTDCSPQELCPNCNKKDFYQLECDDSEDDDDDDDTDDRDSFIDNEDVGQTDDDSDEDEDEDEDDDDCCSIYAPGNIVWARYGKYFYPAKIISFIDLPEHLHRNFRVRKAESVIVSWYGENNFSWVKTRFIDELSENKIDASRAAQSEEIQVKYQMAVADLRD